MYGATVIDMKQIETKIKAKMGDGEEAFEGDVPISKVEEEITNLITESKGSN
jgi:hypothetical protein